jgi:hypothetical protein
MSGATLVRVELVDVSLSSRASAVSVFVELLREADAPLDARTLQHRLVARGYAPTVVNMAWRKAQPVVRQHTHIAFDAVRGAYHYRLADAEPVTPLSADDALDTLLGERGGRRRAALGRVVRAALRDRDDLEVRLRSGYSGGRDLRESQERAVQIEAVRALVDVVTEVEELTAAGADHAVLTERIRGLAQAFGLEPIGRAGEQVAFGSSRHTPIGSRPSDEERVVVIRPGYSWRRGAEVVLVSKAHVARLADSAHQ